MGSIPYSYDDEEVPSNGGIREKIRQYDEIHLVKSPSIGILFLAADSKRAVRNKLNKRVEKWSAGALRRLSADVRGLERAFVEGGECGARLALDSAEECHEIQKACDGQGTKRVTLKSYFNVRKEEAIELLGSLKFEVLHFSGHGSEKYGLAFQQEMAFSDVRQTSILCTEILDVLKQRDRPLGLAFVASCMSCKFAKQLVDSGLVDVAVGVDGEVLDDRLIRFVSAFYNALILVPNTTGARTLRDNIYIAYAKAQLREKLDKLKIYPEPVRYRKLIGLEYTEGGDVRSATLESDGINNDYDASSLSS